MGLKFKQIAANATSLYGLDEEGKVWEYQEDRWDRLRHDSVYVTADTINHNTEEGYDYDIKYMDGDTERTVKIFAYRDDEAINLAKLLVNDRDANFFGVDYKYRRS